MQNFGEMYITMNRDNTHQAKSANQGTPGIWVGYAEHQPNCTFWVFNPKIKRLF